MDIDMMYSLYPRLVQLNICARNIHNYIIILTTYLYKRWKKYGKASLQVHLAHPEAD